MDGKQMDGRTIFFDVNGVKKNAWETCIWYCDQLNSVGYTLESDYATNFAVHNENSDENILTIPLDNSIRHTTSAHLSKTKRHASPSCSQYHRRASNSTRN